MTLLSINNIYQLHNSTSIFTSIRAWPDTRTTCLTYRIYKYFSTVKATRKAKCDLYQKLLGSKQQ